MKAKRRIRKSSRFIKGTFKTPGTFPGTFNLDILVEVIILVHSLKKGNRVNGNLGQTSQLKLDKLRSN